MLLRRATPLAGLLVALVVSPQQPSWSRSEITEILSRYAAGDYSGAIKIIESVDQLRLGKSVSDQLSPPDDAFIDWQHATKDWIRLGTAPTGRPRELIAATVALEVVRAHPELAPYRSLSFLTWACQIVRDHPKGSEAERLWYLTSIAVIQESSLVGLLPAKREDTSVRLTRSPDDRAEVLTGHVTHAIRAFPDEARFRLAEVLARAALTSVAAFSGARNWMDANELPMKHPPSNSDQARLLDERLALLPAIEQDLEALARNEQLRAEVELNLGHLSARQQRWDQALAHLDRVVPSTHDVFLMCLSHYLRGWVLQRMNRRDDAIAAYRLALERAPNARSFSTMLADQLAQAGRQREAYDVLSSGLKTSAAATDARTMTVPVGRGRAGPVLLNHPSDPWDQFQHGDARLIPTYLTQLREALR